MLTVKTLTEGLLKFVFAIWITEMLSGGIIYGMFDEELSLIARVTIVLIFGFLTFVAGMFATYVAKDFISRLRGMQEDDELCDGIVNSLINLALYLIVAVISGKLLTVIRNGLPSNNFPRIASAGTATVNIYISLFFGLLLVLGWIGVTDAVVSLGCTLHLRYRRR